jgi:hypothetical protein
LRILRADFAILAFKRFRKFAQVGRNPTD